MICYFVLVLHALLIHVYGYASSFLLFDSATATGLFSALYFSLEKLSFKLIALEYQFIFIQKNKKLSSLPTFSNPINYYISYIINGTPNTPATHMYKIYTPIVVC